VVLRDGAAARIRPISPHDSELLREFHGRLSSETVYYRYFAPHPELSVRELDHLTHVDHVKRVALVVILRGELIGVGRFESIDGESAEVAFVIRDDVQGQGVGSLLLEHLAAAGRERGYRKFVADVLPHNGRMLSTFRFAGYDIEQGTSDGVVAVSFNIADSDAVDTVRESRQQRSEAGSLVSLMEPRSIAIVGVSRRGDSMGDVFLVNLIAGGFTGRLFVIHPEAEHIRGIQCVGSLTQIPHPVDVVVIAVPAEQVRGVINDAAQIRAKGLIIVSSGFSDAPSRAELGRVARAAGMRLLGPAAFGIINTRSDISANCSLKIPMPAPGMNAFFCQSGALGSDTLRRLMDRGLGVSSFMSAGHRVDVSGNDALQYWSEDDASRVILMHLETLGNPRKFIRLVTRVVRHKPVVILRTLGARAHHPWGHPPEDSLARGVVLDQLLADTGVIEARTVEHMLDVAEIIDHCGVVTGNRIGIVGNSEALEILARNAAEQEGLHNAPMSWTMVRASTPDAYRRSLDDALMSDAVDIVIALHVPPVESATDRAVSEVIDQLATGLSKPVIAVVVGADTYAAETRDSEKPSLRKFPVFSDVERALQALGSVVRYGEHLKKLQIVEPLELQDEVDTQLLRDQVAALLHDDATVSLDGVQGEGLLNSYGLNLRIPPDDVGRRAIVVSGIDDMWMGRMVGLSVADPVASLFVDTRYAWAPISVSDARQTTRASAVYRLLRAPEGNDGGELTAEEVDSAVQSVAAILTKVGDVMHDVPHIVKIMLHAEISVSGEAYITKCSMDLSRVGTDRPWATRSLPPVTG